MVGRGLQVSVEIKHVAGVRGVGRPGAPGNPDTHLAAHRGFPGHEVLAWLVGAPPPVAGAQVRQPLEVSGVLGVAFFRALVVGDEVALLGRCEMLREARIFLVGQQDASEVGLRLEAAEGPFERGEFFAEGVGLRGPLHGLGRA